MSLHKFLIRPLSLASAALVLHVGAAAAADSGGDIQQQVRAMLTGSTVSTARSEPRDEQATTSTVDSQEFARRLLLGTSAAHVRNTEAIELPESAGVPGESKGTARARSLSHGDMQAMVRRLLLGQHSAATNAS